MTEVVAAGHPPRLPLPGEPERLQVLELFVRILVVEFREVEGPRCAADLGEAVRHRRRETRVGGRDPIPRFEGRRVGSPADSADPDRLSRHLPGRPFGGDDEDDAPVRDLRRVELSEGCPQVGGRGDLFFCDARPVGRDRVSQGGLAVRRADPRTVLRRIPARAEEGIHLQARNVVRVSAERLVPDRVEPVGHDAVEREDVGRLGMALHDDDVREPASDLHEGVRKSLDAVATYGVHRS
ncbi:MAG: hypothetical protein E6K10_09470 [Methanobacteriota archaeon]|nr:MAG: hypothetical protein E6K10_09470 [Euryarchaeota archaeon]